MRTRRSIHRALLVALSLGGCVLGFRGDGSFVGDHGLEGIDTVRIDLPSTPMVVRACDHQAEAVCPARLQYDGRWMSTGGTRSDAEAATTRPRLQFDREGSFAALRAVLPLSVRGLVDLQMGEIVLPDDRDLDVRTDLGDIEVLGSIAAVIIEVETGQVRVRGADAGLAVRTSLGDIDIESPGHVDLRTSEGDVRLRQTGDARDAIVVTGEGDVLVELADDANVDLRVRATGTIRVQTSRMTALTSGRYDRRLGTSEILIDVRTEDGDIEIVEAP